MSATLPSFSGRNCRSGHRPPERGSAHRAPSLTSPPEHCVAPPTQRTIDQPMHTPAVARPVALLEREQEVERMRAVLHAAGRRGGGALVIEAAPGMGKSRLLEEARAQAADLGVRVL